MGKKNIYATLHNTQQRPVSAAGQEIPFARYIPVTEAEFNAKDVQELIRKQKIRYNLVTAQTQTPEPVVEEESPTEEEEESSDEAEQETPKVKPARAKAKNSN